MFKTYFQLFFWQIRYLWLVFFVISPIPLSAQKNPTFRHVSIDQGLSNSSVLSIVQDQDGYMWFGTRHGVNRYNGHSIRSFFPSPGDLNNISSSYVRTMYCDSKGMIWMGSTGGICRYNPQNRQTTIFTSKSPNSHKITHDVINKVVEDKKENIWAASNSGLNLFVRGQADKIIQLLPDQIIYTIYPDDKEGIWLSTPEGLMYMTEHDGQYAVQRIENISTKISEIPQNHIATIHQDEDQLYIGTSASGLFVYNTESNKFYNISTDSKSPLVLSHNNIRDLLRTRDERLWIATQKGINVIDWSKNSIEVYQNRADDPNSLSQNSVYTLYEDRQGLVWVGSYFGGVDVTQPTDAPFNVLQHHQTKNSISSNIISGIAQDSKGNLWIGTEAEGINVLNPHTGVFHTFREHPTDPHHLKSNLIKAIHIDSSDGVWIATYMGGLNYLHPKTKQIVNYRYTSDKQHSLASNNVNCLLEDSQGRFWVGTNVGVQLLDRRSKYFYYLTGEEEQQDPLRNLIIQYLYEDQNQDIWIGTIAGLYVLRKGQSAYEYVKLPHHEFSRTHKINCIYQDSQGDLWVGIFQGGLYRINPKKPKHNTHFSTKDGIPGADVVGILEERDGVLWISTNNGLCRFDTYSQQILTYNRADGLPSNAFNNMAFFKSKDGRLYFGGYKGLVSFLPTDIRTNTFSPTPIIEAIQLVNREHSQDATIEIPTNKKETPRTKLSYRDNSFTVTFASLNYYKSSKNSYSYKLEGVDHEWKETSSPQVSYTNIPGGNYVFLLKARNNDGFWSEGVAKLDIQVKPPFWKTGYAYTLYLLLVVAFLYALIQYFVMRKVLQKEKEIQQAKLSFFTNISHEIRTPLTLISAPLERIFSKPTHSVPISELYSVRDNANRLQQLVNELLDFRKIETNNITLHRAEGDLSEVIRRTFGYFEEERATRNIDLYFQADTQTIPFVFDSFQLEKVFFNLLSNAFKYVDDGGKIVLDIKTTEDEILLELTDNGVGIANGEESKLFTAFYRADSSNQAGTGLGLAIAKTIVELHGGSIAITGRERTAAHHGFTQVRIRFKKQLANAQRMPEANQPIPILSACVPVGLGHKNKILVVEDNLEMNRFICDLLHEQYDVISVTDGQGALSQCHLDAPDLILSDVAMPGMDGFTLCHSVKQDEELNHIPVILLTAKTDSRDQLEGLARGADLYISKPFRVDFLRLSINNLLRSREVIRLKISRFVQTGVSDSLENTAEKAFIEKIIGIIEADISNPDINVPHIIQEMGMHHQALYKKVRAITGLSVHELIKSTRLKKAAELLKDPMLNISEVAYAVGFSDPKYFSKEFKKQFKVSPSAYKK